MIKELKNQVNIRTLESGGVIPLHSLDDAVSQIVIMTDYFRNVFIKYGKMYITMEDQQIDEDMNLIDVTTEQKAYPATSILHAAVGRGKDFKTYMENIISTYSGRTVATEQYEEGSSCDLGQALCAIMNAVCAWDYADALINLDL